MLEGNFADTCAEILFAHGPLSMRRPGMRSPIGVDRKSSAHVKCAHNISTYFIIMSKDQQNNP